MSLVRRVFANDLTPWFLLVLGVIYIGGNIASGSLTTWDEAVYANISAQILRTGDWLILHQGTSPWFDKTPLYMWCTALWYNIFGVNEFSVRLTSALFAAATIAVVYLFAKKIFNERAALIAALVLLASPHYLHYAKMGMLDVTLTFFITLIFYLFWRAQEDPRYLFLPGIVFGIGYLVKGMAIITAPLVIVVYCLLAGQWRTLVRPSMAIGFLVGCGMIAAWHYMQYLRAGQAALDSYFNYHIVQRATTTLEGHTGGPNFYQKTIFNKNIPWSVVFYPSILYAFWLGIAKKCRPALFVGIWALVVYLVCTIVQTKLHWYIMPVYPALALASGLLLERLARGRMFAAAIGIIVIGMLAQVPFSWAFNMDLNHKVKAAAAQGERLSYADDGTEFYYETIHLKIGKGR